MPVDAGRARVNRQAQSSSSHSLRPFVETALKSPWLNLFGVDVTIGLPGAVRSVAVFAEDLGHDRNLFRHAIDPLP